MKKESACPCRSGKSYKDCCKPFHKGNKLPKTAEALMRARYCAYAKNLRAFLMDTWHPTTRPPDLQLEPNLQWTNLEILSTSQGGERDLMGTVTFTAHYALDGAPGSMTEESRFLREGSGWFYLKGNQV
jgi:SEC-C motif-containing protein